jgi:hypothetical protein
MNQSTVSRSPARAQRAIGALFFFVFGGAWLALWAWFTFSPRWLPLTAIAIISTALLLLAWRIYRANVSLEAKVETPAEKRQSFWFNVINAGQWVLMFVAANVLIKLGLSGWILPALIGIVGLHFIPLAPLLANPAHYLTGSALILLAVVYPMLADGGPRSALGALGAGLILWISAAWAVSPFAAKV